MDLVRFCILWTQGSFCFDIMDDAVDLIQRTVDINAIPIVSKTPIQHTFVPGADGGIALLIMGDIARSVLYEERKIRRFFRSLSPYSHQSDPLTSKRFWRLVRQDFPVILLQTGQPMEHITTMVSILCTSISDESFGPTVTSQDEQRRGEDLLLNGMTNLLVHIPEDVDPSATLPTSRVLHLRNIVLEFFGCLVGTQGGKNALLIHKSALNRISRRIAEEVDELYEWRRGQKERYAGSIPFPLYHRGQNFTLLIAAHRTHFINNLVRLLSGIISLDPAACRPKLTGGLIGHRHIVSMARLAFSDGLAQEKGIEDDVTVMAQDVLETVLTPNEAEELYEIFCPDQSA